MPCVHEAAPGDRAPCGRAVPVDCAGAPHGSALARPQHPRGAARPLCPTCARRLLGVTDSAHYLGITRRTVYELYACGDLRRVRLSLEHQDVRRLLYSTTSTLTP